MSRFNKRRTSLRFEKEKKFLVQSTLPRKNVIKAYLHLCVCVCVKERRTHSSSRSCTIRPNRNKKTTHIVHRANFKAGNCIERKRFNFLVRFTHTHRRKKKGGKNKMDTHTLYMYLVCCFFFLPVDGLKLSNSVSYGALESKRVDNGGSTVRP